MAKNHKIAVIGTGAIGSSWAVCFLAHGYRLVASDPGEGAVDLLRQLVDKYCVVA